MQLQELKNQYLSALKIASVEIEHLDPKTRYQAEGMKNSAKQQLLKLKPQLMQLILNESTTVMISKDVDMLELLNTIVTDTSNKNVTAVDFFGLEKHLMGLVYPQDKIKGYAFNTGTVSMLNGALLNLRNYIRAERIAPVEVKSSEYRVLKTHEEAFAHLSDLLSKYYQNTLKMAFLARQVNDFLDKVVSSEDKVVVFIYGVDGNTTGLSNLTGKTVTITNEDVVPTTPAELKLLLTGKLKKPRKSLTKDE